MLEIPSLLIQQSMESKPSLLLVDVVPVLQFQNSNIFPALKSAGRYSLYIWLYVDKLSR